MENQKPSFPAFVIDPQPKVWWPVQVRVPAQGGRFEIHQFSALIRVLSEDEFDELGSTAKKLPQDEAVDAKAAAVRRPMKEILAENADLFAKVVFDWGEEVRDAKGEVVPFSQETLAAQVKGPFGGPLSAGLWTAINEVRVGARLGNYEVPPATGLDSPAEAAPTK